MAWSAGHTACHVGRYGRAFCCGATPFEFAYRAFACRIATIDSGHLVQPTALNVLPVALLS